jgi:hypothetical protein
MADADERSRKRAERRLKRKEKEQLTEGNDVHGKFSFSFMLWYTHGQGAKYGRSADNLRQILTLPVILTSHFRWKNKLRACSYDPAYRDVSLTDDLAVYLFSYKILHCVHMRKRAGPLAEISFEFAEIIGRRDENFSIW